MMEYCKYGSLGDILKRHAKLSEVEIREITGCCVLGLNEIHSNKIMHSVGIHHDNYSIGHETRQHPYN